MSVKCPVCNLSVELDNVEEYSDYDKQYYSCGHIVKHSRTSIKGTPVDVNDNASATKNP